MPYCTTAELASAIGKPFAWAEGAAATNAPTEAEGADIIARKQAVIDGYCASRYSVPFDPVPGAIADLCLDLAGAEIVGTWLKHSKDDIIYQRWRAKEKDALARLKDIKNDNFDLPTDDTTETTSGGPDYYPAPPPMFTHDMEF